MPLARIAFVVLLSSAACTVRDVASGDSARVAAPPAGDSSPARVATDTTAPPASSRWVVTPQGIGPVLSGMSVAALGSTLGEALRPTYGAGSQCAYVRPAALPHDVLVMVERDTVARVDVRARGVLTEEGAGIGDTEASVLKRYEGRVRTSPHKYAAGGHYLTVSAPPDSAHLIVFETDGRTVTTYRAGRRAAVELVEGCA